MFVLFTYFMKKVFLLLLLFSFSFSSLRAQTFLWGAQPTPGPGTSGDDFGGDHYIAADGQGNTYFTGFLGFGYVFFGTYFLNVPEADMFLVKYNKNGKVLWAQCGIEVDAASSGVGNSVAVDAAGDAYVTGYFIDTLYFGSVKLFEQWNGSFNGDVFIAKYDKNGNALWAKKAVQANSNGTGSGVAVCTDASENAYLAGNFSDTLTFGNYKMVSSVGSIFLVKYDKNGNVLWAIHNNSGTLGGVNSDAVDASGNIYISGTFTDTLSFGSVSVTTVAPYGSAYVAKFDASGNIAWIQKGDGGPYGGMAPDFGTSVSVDGAGNIYVTGGFLNNMTFGSISLNSSAGSTFLAKYDPNGNVIWAENGGSGCIGFSVACDTLKRGGGYLVMSDYEGPGGLNKVGFRNMDTLSVTTPGNRSVSVLLAFDAAGKIACGSIFSEGLEDDGDAVAVDPSGQYVYIGGDIDDTTIFAKDTLVYGNDMSYVAHWQPCVIPDDTNNSQNSNDTIPCISSCVYVPNAFSPNGDGHNDIEYVYGKCINTMDFIIFDRWGNKIFESENMHNGWDGTYKGQSMNTGSFAYYLTALLQDGTAVTKKGNIALVR